MIKSRLKLFATAILTTMFLCCLPAKATRLSVEMRKAVENAFDAPRVRLDGSLETAKGDLYLVLVPPGGGTKKGKVEVLDFFREQNSKQSDIIFYSNGWAHVRLTRKGTASTIAVPKDLPEKVRKKLMTLRFPSDLIVPENFTLSKSLKSLGQDISVSVVEDDLIDNPSFGKAPGAKSVPVYSGSGTVFLTSITAGSITMLDGKTLEKVAEFPTEGTPCSMDFVDGKLYIADQAKNRILILDPTARKFLGQFDLPPKTAPKGLVAMPTGQWLYASDSRGGNIVSVEIATGKLLMKTKVRPGPGHMAITPDGAFLLVLNATSGEVTIISTSNQRVAAIVKVGDLPSCLAISPEGKTAYISNRISNSVSVLDIARHQIVGTIKTGEAPTGVAMSTNGKKLFVANGRQNTITVYDTVSLVKLGEAHLPDKVKFPGALCLLPAGNRLVVLGQEGDGVAILDTEKMEFEPPISLGHPFHEVVWEPIR
jgi:YVTN family beta-propeller protein